MPYDADSDVQRYRKAQRDDRGFFLNPGGPMPTYGWEAFFGSQLRNADEAAARGLNYRTDLSGIGNPAYGQLPGGGLQYPSDRGALEKNKALAQMSDENRATKLGDAGAAIALQEDAAAGLRRGLTEHQIASAGVGLDLNTPTGQQTFLARLPPDLRPVYAAQFQNADLANRKQAESEAAQAEVARHNQATEALTGAAMLSGDAVDIAARNYLQTGQMPPLGMGDKTSRQRILDRAGEIAAGGGGLGGNVAANAADYKANSESLKTMQKQRDAISAFENTAQKNIDIFLNTAGKVVDTGSPLLNAPARAVSGKMLGSPDQAAYEAARTAAMSEIAKIINNPNLSGTLSDSARHEIQSFNPDSATLKQTVAVMRLLKQDMANRASSLDQGLTEIRGRLSKGDAAAAPGSAKPDAAARAAELIKKYGG